jgi:AraC-like DNA-binding protein
VSEVYYFILQVILMFIPVFYLYILSITQSDFRFRKAYSIHFLPAIGIGFLNIPYLLASPAEKLNFISHTNSNPGNGSMYSYLFAIYMVGIFGIYTAQLIYYSVMAFRVYRNHKIYIANRYSYTENINLDWILVSIMSFVIFFLFNDIFYLIGFRGQIITQVIYIVSMLGTTLYVGYRGLQQYDINHSTQNTDFINSKEKIIDGNSAKINTTINSLDNTILNNDNHEYINVEKQDNIKKYSGSTLTEQQKTVLISKLHLLMQDEKIFFNSKLSIEDVAVKLDTNSKYISQIINETFNKNFYNFINSYRIEEAKILLLSEENAKYSILGIAQTVGFVSKSAFNSAFKRFTGLTPSAFKNNETKADS